jgi:hypothetical protein
VDGYRDRLVVPQAVAVRPAQAERVLARIEVRVGDRSLSAQRDPLGVEALELVREQIAVGRGEIQGGELEPEHLLAEAEADALRLVGGAAEGAMVDADAGQHDLGRL